MNNTKISLLALKPYVMRFGVKCGIQVCEVNPAMWCVCLCVCAVPDEEPTGPVFTTWPQSQNVDEGNPVTFSCTLDSPAALTGLYVCVCVQLCECVYVYERECVCVSAWVSVCVCVRGCEYMCVCVRGCLYTQNPKSLQC